MSNLSRKPNIPAILTLTTLLAIATALTSCNSKPPVVPPVAPKVDSASHRAAVPDAGNSATATAAEVVTETAVTGVSVEAVTGLTARRIIALTRDEFGERYDAAGRKKGVAVTAREGMYAYAEYGQAAVAEEIAGLRDGKTREAAAKFARQLRAVAMAYGEVLYARKVGTMVIDFSADAGACVEETLHTVVQGMAKTTLRDIPRSVDAELVAALAKRLHKLAQAGANEYSPSVTKELEKISAAITATAPTLGRLPESSAAPVREMLKHLVSVLEDKDIMGW